MRKARIQTENFVLDSGTVAGTYDLGNIQLEEGYDICSGFYMQQNIGGGLTYYRLQVSKDGNNIADMTNANHYQVSTGVAIKDRFYRETPFAVGTGKVKITVEVPGTLTQDLNIDMIFELKRRQDCD